VGSELTSAKSENVAVASEEMSANSNSISAAMEEATANLTATILRSRIAFFKFIQLQNINV